MANDPEQIAEAQRAMDDGACAWLGRRERERDTLVVTLISHLLALISYHSILFDLIISR